MVRARGFRTLLPDGELNMRYSIHSHFHRNRSALKTWGSRFGVLISLMITLTNMLSPVVGSALAPCQKKLLQENINYYNCQVDCAPAAASASAISTTPGQTTGPPNAVQKVIWDTLTSNGIDDIHAAAIMGSIDNEGAWDPENVGYFPNNFDSKDPTVPTAIRDGYGLIGWTPGSNLIDDMKTLGLGSDPPYTAETQAQVIVGYLQNKTGRYSSSDVSNFLNATTLPAASTEWIGGPGWGFERPKDNGPDAQQKRLQSAKEMIRKYGGTTGSATTATASDAGGSGGGCACTTSTSSASTGSTTLTGNTNAEKIFNYLEDNEGLTDNQAAGAVGSMMLESGGNSLNIDPTATNPGSQAYGIAQWYPGSRLDGLEQFATKQGTDKSDLLTQIQYLMQEMNSNINGYDNNTYKKQATLNDSVTYWTDYFEGLLNNPSQQYIAQRTKNANTILNSANGGDANGDPTTAAAVSPSSSAGCSCSSSASTNDLDSLLKGLADKNGGKTSISVQSIDGSSTGNANGDVQMPTRSSYKIYTAYATLRAIEAGKLSWGSNVSSGGWSGSVLDTMEQMIVYSNNDAAESLRLNNTIGTPAQVTQMLQNDLGLSNKTVMGNGLASDPAGSNSQSTANDFTKFLSLLYSQKLTGVSNKDDYDKLIGFMKRATTDGGSARDGIVAGIGSGTEVADKPGWAPAGVDPASNDVGIVYLAGNPYVIAILTDKPDQWDGVAAIAKGVNDAINGGASSGGSGGGGCATADATGLAATVQSYAWPTYSSVKTDPEPAFKKAIDNAQANGQYVGQIYTDCGGFVTRVMIDSGYEPNYNYSGDLSKGAGNTINQEAWLKANWQKVDVTTTKDLQPGDVAISDVHTYLYMGSEGFKGYDSVSASQGSRTPMASSAYDLNTFTWYRKP